jgi:hypothetical protein
MGVLDTLMGREESMAIIKMVGEQGMFEKKIHFDENFFYHSFDGDIDKNGENVYIKRNIEYVIVHESYHGNTDNIFYSIDGVEKGTKSVNRQVITMVYLKLQDYVREFEGNP